MAKEKHVWFGMKVTPAEKRKIEKLAEREGTSQKAVVMGLVEEATHEYTAENPRPGSFLEATRDLCGSVEGPIDLSTNPKYMEGYGEDSNR